MQNNERQPSPTTVWWILWVVMLAGLPQMYLLVRTKTPSTENTNVVFAVCISMIPLLASCILRWVVLPRMKRLSAAFPVFILGMAIAESLAFFGLFLFPAFKLPLMTIAALGMLQFAPYYANKYQS